MPVRTDDTLNGVYNDGACIKVAFNGNVIQINKAQIKTIDTIRNDTVRIDIGEGPLKNIYVRLSDVIFPESFKDVITLRNYINDLLIQNTFSTEAKQDAEINELQQIRQAFL